MPAPLESDVPSAALTGSMRDYAAPRGAGLQDRTAEFFAWQDLRRKHGLWSYARSTQDVPATVTTACEDSGAPIGGTNFASQDYLSLSVHPAIRQTAQEAIERFGVHSAGSSALMGNTSHAVALERRIADFLGMPEAILFPTGWAAGYGVIKGLVRPADHLVMDSRAHACLQEGARSATGNVHHFRHNDLGGCRSLLRSIRAGDSANGIMVVTESLFSMDSDAPDLAAMQEMCHEYNATLLVDAAHDLGNMGPRGRGFIGEQAMIGKIDLVMGSFSKTFASNGGFVACADRSVKEYLRFFSPPCTFSNALSPVQAATVLKAFEIVEDAEGGRLRDRLMANITALRHGLGQEGFSVYGDPSAIVCVDLGPEGLARLVSRRLPEFGLLANLVEFPAVPMGKARLRMQVMADHTSQNVHDAVAALTSAVRSAKADDIR
ncbi:glycine C-acetyltransferase [Allocatelliglobosispora scoriae]|uniref:8-amino-7-oxononanoate synthase n=1 Tax=Allocatelliglobosispora scoriae TaxID=643052 RepID=A0A841BL91_9ACTN|nr:aminotransferase class I/II-fold pyridoxal phosphate-dependent enzyme [Allocatelliglobosispora scoriae]MBB5867753.1 glycine C-acetyltransferase [Allocatelliglobosispora scoriae]